MDNISHRRTPYQASEGQHSQQPTMTTCTSGLLGAKHYQHVHTVGGKGSNDTSGTAAEQCQWQCIFRVEQD